MKHFHLNSSLSLLAYYCLILCTISNQKYYCNGLKLESEAFIDGEEIPVDFTCQGLNLAPPLSWTDVPKGTQSFALTVDDPDVKPFVHNRTEMKKYLREHGNSFNNTDGHYWHEHHGAHHAEYMKHRWSHWVVFDIPKQITRLDLIESAGKLPTGWHHGRNDFNTEEYSGPCPPSNGRHDYVFQLYALDIAVVEQSETWHSYHMGMRNGMDNSEHKRESSTEMKRGMSRNHLERAIENHVLAQASLTGTYEKIEK